MTGHPPFVLAVSPHADGPELADLRADLGIRHLVRLPHVDGVRRRSGEHPAGVGVMVDWHELRQLVAGSDREDPSVEPSELAGTVRRWVGDATWVFASWASQNAQALLHVGRRGGAGAPASHRRHVPHTRPCMRAGVPGGRGGAAACGPS